MTTLAEDLKTLASLRKGGDLTSDQYADARQFIINEHKKLGRDSHRSRSKSRKSAGASLRGNVKAIILGVIVAIVLIALQSASENDGLGHDRTPAEPIDRELGASPPSPPQSSSNSEVARAPRTPTAPNPEKLTAIQRETTATATVADIAPNAAYLPEGLSVFMPQLRAAIQLVADQHQGCQAIDNASFSEAYARLDEPAFFVSCKMNGGQYSYQNVYVRDGRIVGTTP